jgi:exosortase
MVGIKLSVEEACSGIRSLLAILFFCALYNYFFVKGNGMKAVIFLAAVPIAILGNATRIVATGIASQYHPSWVTGTAHETFGYVSVAAASIGCILLHLVLVKIQQWRSARG